MKSIKEQKKYGSVYYQICFSLKVVIYFLKIQEMTKINRNLIFKGNNFIFQVKALLKLTIIFNCACFMHFHSYLETHF